MTETVLVSKVYFKKVEHRSESFVCYHCHRDLAIGDSIVSRPMSPGRRKYYCASCWEAMFV